MWPAWKAKTLWTPFLHFETQDFQLPRKQHKLNEIFYLLPILLCKVNIKSSGRFRQIFEAFLKNLNFTFDSKLRFFTQNHGAFLDVLWCDTTDTFSFNFHNIVKVWLHFEYFNLFNVLIFSPIDLIFPDTNDDQKSKFNHWIFWFLTGEYFKVTHVKANAWTIEKTESIYSMSLIFLRLIWFFQIQIRFKIQSLNILIFDGLLLAGE